MQYPLTAFSHIIMILMLFTSSTLAQESVCNNGIDDDNDGFIDCADSECHDNNLCDSAFLCSNTLYQVISASLKKLDPLTGQYETIGSASASYNGAGFNVQDGYIYGINNSNGGPRLWRIDNTGQETDLGGIINFEGRTFVGDFDEEGNLYTYTSGSFPTISSIDVDAAAPESITQDLTNESGKSIPGVADITYNPLQERFFGLAGNHQLLVIDHKSKTCDILGDFSDYIDEVGSFGAAWSDQDGSSYFSNNKTGNIYRFTFSLSGDVLSVEYVATGQPTNSNDGMGCFFSLPPFETSCVDNIDNDGDGLIDCEDPDCASTGACPAVTIQPSSIQKAGPHSIVPFYIELTNNSSVDANNFILKSSMPEGFSFVSDTIEYSAQASFTEISRPIENDQVELRWEGLNIPVGDTISIAYNVLVNRDVVDSSFNFSFNLIDVIQSPFVAELQLEVEEQIFYSTETYDCEPAFYQVYKKRGQPNVLGKLNPTTGEYSKISIINHQANGLGFDINSGFAYGTDGKKFIRIDDKGNVTYMGFDFESKVYVGDVDDNGNWYGKVGRDMVKVNLSQMLISDRFVGQGMSGWDMAYNNDGHFYAVHKQELFQFNTSTNTKSSLGQLSGEAVPNGGHGAQWTGIDGYHYISNNSTGKIFRVNVQTGSAQQCMIAESNLQFNDGFACPNELPAVFQYDFGDNSKFPEARQLVYQQDIGNDNIPDYGMVWLGDEVSFEATNPSDENAAGDSFDDGFSMGNELVPGNNSFATLILHTNRSNMDAAYGIWMDWDNDGIYENFYSGEHTIDSITIVQIPIAIPIDFIETPFAVRVRVSTDKVLESNFSGDINEPGEVEDYIIYSSNEEICGNGYDDDNDGLIDCDDIECANICKYSSTGSSGNGGLESTDNLINKITKAFYQREMDGIDDSFDKKQLQNIKSSEREVKSNKTKVNSNFSLEDLIPTDVIENSETYISSPLYLTDLTNALDLFSVDIFQEDDRVAAILLLESGNGVYEHTKYICDRLTGSEILDILPYKIDGINDFVIAKLKLADGGVEYALSFSVRENQSGQMTLESHWNLEDYSNSKSFLNFQIWANNTKNLVALASAVISQINSYSAINEYSIGAAPEVYVQSGSMHEGKLQLNIVNKLGVNQLSAVGTIGRTETTEKETFTRNISLSGEEKEEISIEFGDVYYLGMALHNNESPVHDALFLANGAWGYSFDSETEEIIDYSISPTAHNHELRHNVSRAVHASGNVLNYISLYRSFAPRFTSFDINEYNSLSFTASGTGKLEIAVVKDGISEWKYQGKTTINLSEKEQEYVLGKSFFTDINGESKSWEDATMLAINVIGNRQSSEPFDFRVTNISFGHQSVEHPVIVYADNILGPKDSEHHASTVDGSSLGSINLEAGSDGLLMKATIENISDNMVYVDQISLSGESEHMRIENFQPFALAGKSKSHFFIRYKPSNNPDSSIATITVDWYNDELFESVNFEVSANAKCVLNDHINTLDLNANRRQHEYKALESVTTDAKVPSNQNITISAKKEIVLGPGFEISAGGELMIVTKDRCTTENK